MRIKRYLSVNHGAIFILLFDILILSCAFIIIQDGELIGSVTGWAFCFLIIGVILQTISYLKHSDVKVSSDG